MMNRIKTTLAVAVLTLLPVEVLSQEGRSTAGSRANAAGSAAVAAQEARSEQARALRTVLSDWSVIRMEPGDIEAQVKESGELALDLKGVGFRFSLLPRDLRSPRYRAEATGPDGVRRQLPLDEVTTYRGLAVSGQEVVQGRFTIDGDRFEGVVFTPGDWHFIESLQHFAPVAGGDEWVVYRQSDIKPGQGWRCGVPHRLQEGRDRLEARAAATDTTTTYKVEVATEADYEYVQHWGSAEAANREIRANLNQVEGVYEDELKLKLEITYQHAWNSSSDPYTATKGSDLLDEFREYWNDNFYSEGYDLAHLWTDRETLKGEDKDGEEINLGGYAWLAEVCKRSYDSFSYGLTKLQYYRASGISLTAHEIGHNFSAVHPNHEDPPVTSCDATIMQGGWDPPKTLTFCQFSRDQIRDHVSDYNSCLEADDAPITLNPPSNLTATALGPHRVRLTWRNANGENEYGFALQRKTSRGAWEHQHSLFRPRQEFIDGSVLPERTYSYRMYAYNTHKDNIESSSWSRTVTATTPPVPVVEPPGLNPLTSNHWVIPTSANLPGRYGGVYKTKVILSHPNRDVEVEVKASLYGKKGLVAQETLSLKPNAYYTYGNFLGTVFGHRGAGAIELKAEKPFHVVSVEVYIESDAGKFTTVVSNRPEPVRPYSSTIAFSYGVTVDQYTRTNLGVFNSSNRSQTVIASVYSGEKGDEPEEITFKLQPKAWSQKTISKQVDNGYIFWRIPREAYPWVVVVDNDSNDGTLTFPIPES